MTSTEEQFSRATRTSHLKLRRDDETPGDAERIVAAGAAQTRHDDEAHKDAQERSLGVLLARLRIEWDAVSSEIKQMHANAAHARALRTLAQKEGDKDFDFQRFDEETAGAINTARALIMMNLRSLAPAKQAMLAFALSKAERYGCGSKALRMAQCEEAWARGLLSADLTPEERRVVAAEHLAAVRVVSKTAAIYHQSIADLIGQVLDAWLDRLCYRCAGRGFTGGWSQPKLMCPSLKQGGCGGSGSKRSANFGTTKAENDFARWLLVVMDGKVEGAMKQVQRKTRNF